MGPLFGETSRRDLETRITSIIEASLSQWEIVNSWQSLKIADVVKQIHESYEAEHKRVLADFEAKEREKMEQIVMEKNEALCELASEKEKTSRLQSERDKAWFDLGNLPNSSARISKEQMKLVNRLEHMKLGRDNATRRKRKARPNRKDRMRMTEEILQREANTKKEEQGMELDDQDLGERDVDGGVPIEYL